MDQFLEIQGTVISNPEVCQEHTQFHILTETGQYKIIRLDMQWQKKDIVFIRIGQIISVSGEKAEGSDPAVIAEKIQIIDDLRLSEEEEHYGHEAIGSADSGDQEVSGGGPDGI